MIGRLFDRLWIPLLLAVFLLSLWHGLVRAELEIDACPHPSYSWGQCFLWWLAH